MSIDFLDQVAIDASNSVTPFLLPKQFPKEVTSLFQDAHKNGLSGNQQEAVMRVALHPNIDMNDTVFQNLILCMIPKSSISADLMQDVILWILIELDNVVYELKIVSLLDWIVYLLSYRLVDKDVVNQFYDSLFTAVRKNWKCLSHLLCLLTKPEDVVSWRINKIQDDVKKYGEMHYYALLKRFKELNPTLSYKSITMRKSFEQIFSDNSAFHSSLRSNLSKRSPAFSTSTASVVVPIANQENRMNNSQDVILPSVQYFDSDIIMQNIDDCLIHEIENGVDLAKKFRKLTLPLNTLSLLNSTIGIHVLMLSKPAIQDHFLSNLYGVLEENLIAKRNRPVTEEVEKLLDSVLQLQQTYQQGFAKVSSIISQYLQFWNGYEYRAQIYSLLEWFVFRSATELNRFVLLPLHSLFISGNPEEKSAILHCLQSLIQNLYSRMAKSAQKYSDIYDEENILKSRDQLIPVIESLTEFTSDLCKIGLYNYPCNNLILLISITFYEKVHGLERSHKMKWWTVISSNVMYHCLFSFNAHLLNQMCGLWMKYRGMDLFLKDTHITKIEDKKDRLCQYAADMFNILWTSKAFVQRMDGHVFTGLSTEDEASWRPYANLNNSLSVEKHIMFTPYRMRAAYQNNNSTFMNSKMDMLPILQNYLPNFTNVLEQMIEEEQVPEDCDLE